MTRSADAIVLLVLFISAGLFAITFAGSVAAQDDDRIGINWESEYDGISEDGTQDVTLSVTLVAEEQTTGLVVDFGPTGESFLDGDSFQVTVADSNWENPVDGRYEIDELSSGEEITFTFDVYPRTLDQSSLEVATIGLQAENPQTYERSQTLDANLSSSPLVQYNQDTAGGGEGGVLPPWLAGAVTILGILGIVVGGYSVYSKREAVNNKQERGLELLKELKAEVQNPNAQRKIREKIDEWESSSDDEDIDI